MTIKVRFYRVKENFTLDANFSVPSKGITAVFGPSGCGKTTLLRMVAGLDGCANGYIKVADSLWQDQHFFVPAHQRSIGYIFQEPSLFPHLNVQQNINYGVKRSCAASQKKSVDNVVELLGIAHLLQRMPDKLSGGEKQRVAIARALAVNPCLLLMDEPLAALDQKRKDEFMPYLETLHAELDIPVIYVSHSSMEVSRLADHLVLMDAGHVIATGDIHTMMTRLDLPVAHDNDAAAIIEAKVVGHDEQYHLTHMEFAGGTINVTQKALQVGDTARLRLAARDVSLTLERQSDTSILNIIPVMVDDIIDESVSQVMVRLSANGVPILSRITRKSASELKLKKGKPVYAQVKSVALLA